MNRDTLHAALVAAGYEAKASEYNPGIYIRVNGDVEISIDPTMCPAWASMTRHDDSLGRATGSHLATNIEDVLHTLAEWMPAPTQKG